MALRLRTVRHGLAQVMDMFGDAVNAVVLLAVIALAWRCWEKTQYYLAKAGGLPAIPRSEAEWSRAGQAFKMMFQDSQWRGRLVELAQGWTMAWIFLILTVAFSVLAVAGLRWAWIRARDMVAGV